MAKVSKMHQIFDLTAGKIYYRSTILVLFHMRKNGLTHESDGGNVDHQGFVPVLLCFIQTLQ